MISKLSRVGNRLALVLPRRLLDALGVDASTRLEISTVGDVIVVAPVRPGRRASRLDALVSEMHREFGGVFRRLAK